VLKVAWLALGVLCLEAPVQGPRLTRTLSLPPDRPISIEATAGEIRVVGGDGADVSIDIATEAPTAAQLALLVPAIDDASGVRIRATQANGGTDPAVRSTIAVRVPRSARLESIKLLTGRILLEDLHGRVSADVTRGALTASNLSGIVRLETGTGDLTCERARLTPGGLLRLRAFNGAVTLGLDQAPADARILALTFNGTIASEIPLQMKTTFGPRFGETTIGKGEPVISIDTVTGDIAIRIQRQSQKPDAKPQGTQSQTKD
jgi:hypothetical protein